MKIINSGSSGREIKHSVLGFSGGERHVQLEGMSSAQLKEVSIHANLQCSDDIMDLLLVENALRNKYGIGLKLNLELPYLPYARQDRVCAPGQAFSLEVFANMLRLLRLNKLVTWDCHSQVGTKLTGAINVLPIDIIRSDEQLLTLFKDQETVLVCPDNGAVGRCSTIRDELKLPEMVVCDKRRDPATGKIYKVDVLTDDLTGKSAVICDDICDSGSTVIQLADQLRAKNANKVMLFVTHGIFSKGLDVFDGVIDRIFTTNSFPQADHAKLKVIDYKYNF